MVHWSALILAFGAGICFGFLIIALMAANDDEEKRRKR